MTAVLAEIQQCQTNLQNIELESEGPQQLDFDEPQSNYEEVEYEENVIMPEDNKNDRKFNCQVCGKSFKTKMSLKVHNRSHTDQRPYVCEVNQRFNEFSPIHFL